MTTPCDTCIETAEHPLFNTPLHVVHPETGRAQVYDIRGVAICRYCGAVWHRGWGCNFPTLLGEAAPAKTAAPDNR